MNEKQTPSEPAGSLTDATRKVRRQMHAVSAATLAVFDPPEERSLRGIARFVLGCRLETIPTATTVPSLPKLLVGGHMVRIGDNDRMTMEFVVVRSAGGEFFALYEEPPPDVRTLLPELGVIDINRSRARLVTLNGRAVALSTLTVDEVNHLIVLAQGHRAPDDGSQVTVEEFDAIEVVFDDDEL